MARVVAQPFRISALTLRREGDRTADLQQHVGDRLAQARQHLVEHRQSLAALAIRLAHMHMQHGGASVPAVDCLLHLFVHADRNVVGVAGQEFRTVGGDLDHQRLLVFWQKRVVEKMHEMSPVAM
ncbi:hypothetical protein FQZ97_853090 [compost metagenome]